MPKVVSTQEMIDIEKAADADGHSYAEMMQQAGHALAERIILNLPPVERPARVTILVGGGNNGGDGLVAGTVVKNILPETEVSAYCLSERGSDDAEFQAAQEAGLFIVQFADDNSQKVLKNLVRGADILVDAIFGTGVRLPLEGDAAKVLRVVDGALERRREAYPTPRSSSPDGDPMASSGLSLTHFTDDIAAGEPALPFIIAADCPSGVDLATGEVDKQTLRADETVTFAAAKYGHFAFPAAEYVGALFIADIGISPKLEALQIISAEVLDAAWVRQRLPQRSADSHKGTHGKTFVVAGSLNYIGAAGLAAGAAYRTGAGLVRVGVPQGILSPLAAQLPEAIWSLLPNDMGVINKAAAKVVLEDANGYDALLVGCGIGDEDETKDFIENLLKPETTATQKASRRSLGLLGAVAQAADETEHDETQAFEMPPLIIDADGLNVLSKIDNWPELLPEGTILTPHPREFARLAGIDEAAEVQANRVALALEKAAAWNAVVVLKGAFTLVAAPDGRLAISPFASDKLATAGTGDVLAGTIASLRGQGLGAFEAAACGVWLHGWAGTHGTLERGVVASDVLFALGEALTFVEG